MDMRCLSFWVHATSSTNKIFSSSIHLLAKFMISFFFIDEKYSIVYMYQFNYPFVIRKMFRWFLFPSYCEWIEHQWTWLSKYLWIGCPLAKYEGVVASYFRLVFSFFKILNTHLQSGWTNLKMHQQWIRVPFSMHPLLFLFVFNHCHSDWGKMKSQNWSDLNFPNC